jgi:iron complex outermembrane receptor protein
MAGGTSTGAASEDETLTEIVVTALKRTMSVQEVPATIVVVSGDELRRQNVTSALDLPSVVPGLGILTSPGGKPLALIHGIGSNPAVASFDQSVSLFVDGVFAGHGQAYATPLFDLKDVEVVKGTQSALLGKNTSIGAVAITTNKPDFTFGYGISYSHEFYLKQNVVDAEVNLPFSDTLAVRVAGQFKQGDGWLHDTLSGQRTPITHDASGRISLRWSPTDQFDWTLSYQQDRLKQEGPEFFVAGDQFGILTGLAAALGDPKFTAGPFDYTQQSGRTGGSGSFDNFSISTEKRLTSTATYDWNAYTFTSLTGYFHDEKPALTNADALPLSPIVENEIESDEQVSQEFRVTSQKIGRFDFVLGAVYLHDVWHHELDADISAPLPLTGNSDNHYTQHEETESVFGQTNIDIVKDLRATVGLRGTKEAKTGDFARYVLVPGLIELIYPGVAPGTLTRHEGDLDGSVGLEYQFDRKQMLYASYSKGTKGGGYQDSPSTLAGAEYKREIARSAEVGAKWGFGDLGHINLALFSTEVSNYQLGNFSGIAFVVDSLDVNSKGVEFDALWAPVAGLTVAANGTYADTWNTHPTGAPTFYGSTLNFSPRWTGSVSLGYNHSLGAEYKLSAEASVLFRSQVLLLIPTTSIIPPSAAYAKANLRVALGHAKSGLEVAVVMRNLNDKRTTVYGYQAAPGIPGATIVSSDEPRTIALQVSIKR